MQVRSVHALSYLVASCCEGGPLCHLTASSKHSAVFFVFGLNQPRPLHYPLTFPLPPSLPCVLKTAILREATNTQSTP